MEIILIAALSGVLTILAPCVLSLLPVIIGGSIQSTNKHRPLLIVFSLSLSVILFTLLLKATTAFIGIPSYVWAYISGFLVLMYGLSLLCPNIWTQLSHKISNNKPDQVIQNNVGNQSNKSAVLLGAALGPVFTTCSPTYALILAIVLPANLTLAITSLLAFSLGMTIPLLAIAYGGQAIVKKLKFLANPNGYFKKILAIILIATGLAVITGLDKDLETYLIEKGFQGTFKFEQSLLKDLNL
jgi:cytochrome c biogenesis protein CcdA